MTRVSLCSYSSKMAARPALHTLGGNQDSVKYQHRSVCSRTAMPLYITMQYVSGRAASLGPTRACLALGAAMPESVAATLAPIYLPAHGAVKPTYRETQQIPGTVCLQGQRCGRTDGWMEALMRKGIITIMNFIYMVFI